MDWFEKTVQSGETWLDIGAHYGYTAIALSRLVGERGRIFAFEPMLSTVGYLAQTCKANRFSQLVVLPFGLADVSAVSLLRLPVTRGMVDSTLVKDGADWFETIQVISLDQLWPSICEGEARVHGVKIDVQGMEIEVLKGMVGTLKTHQPRLVVEVHHGVDRNELLDILAAAGYSREARPVEPLNGEETVRYIDNRSYAFHLIE